MRQQAAADTIVTVGRSVLDRGTGVRVFTIQVGVHFISSCLLLLYHRERVIDDA